MKTEQAVSSKIRYVITAATGHSGSTILAMLLDSHSEIASVGECATSRRTWRKGKDPSASYRCSCGSQIRECVLWSTILSRIHPAGIPSGRRLWLNDDRYVNQLAHRLLSSYHAGSPWRQIQSVADRWLPFHRSRVADATKASASLADVVLRLTGKSVFFDSNKSLRKIRSLSSCQQIDLRVIRLVRDVRSYVVSRRRRGMTAREAATEWLKYQQAADVLLESFPSERVLVVRYEDLCSDPAHAMRSLHDFIGVLPEPVPTTLIPRKHHVIGNGLRLSDAITLQPVSWHGKTSEEDDEHALKVVGDYHCRWGYHKDATL